MAEAQFTLPELPYKYDALEPYIDAQTMELHYTKHHQGYLDKLNAALENHNEYFSKDITEILRNIKEVPDDIKQQVINNGGGYANHMLFWEIMGPDAGGEPTGELLSAIERKFDSFDDFKEEFSNAASTRFGSGWAWLVLDDGELKVLNTPNQDSPYMQGLTPIMGLDVWEHAYYLKYQNRRPEYIENWWNVVNWNKVSELYNQNK